ncbi:hypothetical protein M885DRAFT_65107 [Pelagophyceae sp. CCMP2097]|nr:hypothetical protein M885DRAFT_65107 [Pelagophyceae sp. CCMP2097]
MWSVHRRHRKCRRRVESGFAVIGFPWSVRRRDVSVPIKGPLPRFLPRKWPRLLPRKGLRVRCAVGRGRGVFCVGFLVSFGVRRSVVSHPLGVSGRRSFRRVRILLALVSRPVVGRPARVHRPAAARAGGSPSTPPFKSESLDKKWARKFAKIKTARPSLKRRRSVLKMRPRALQPSQRAGGARSGTSRHRFPFRKGSFAADITANQNSPSEKTFRKGRGARRACIDAGWGSLAPRAIPRSAADVNNFWLRNCFDSR